MRDQKSMGAVKWIPTKTIHNIGKYVKYAKYNDYFPSSVCFEVHIDTVY